MKYNQSASSSPKKTAINFGQCPLPSKSHLKLRSLYIPSRVIFIVKSNNWNNVTFATYYACATTKNALWGLFTSSTLYVKTVDNALQQQPGASVICQESDKGEKTLDECIGNIEHIQRLIMNITSTIRSYLPICSSPYRDEPYPHYFCAKAFSLRPLRCVFLCGKYWKDKTVRAQYERHVESDLR